MKATLRASVPSAASAIRSGMARSVRRSSWRALEMSQFWQKRQPRLQPAVPNDSTLLPGWSVLTGDARPGETKLPRGEAEREDECRAN